jgi:pimeloyl-ACP methyl ester carboxylesterase
VLWPRKGLRTAEKIVASLPHGCRIVVHGFSTGGYLYSLMMQGFVRAMRSNRCRVSGCVFDCAVDVEGIADGMANALSKRQSIQAIVKSLTSMYLRTTHSLTTHFYIKASDSFKNPPAELKVPVSFFPRCHAALFLFHTDATSCQILVLAGGNDSIAPVATQEKVVLAWRSQGIPSRIAVFDGAKHCQLLVHSPQLYYSELRSFFSSLDSTPG